MLTSAGPLPRRRKPDASDPPQSTETRVLRTRASEDRVLGLSVLARNDCQCTEKPEKGRLSLSEGYHPVLYVAANSGVYVSTDNGASWTLFPETTGEICPTSTSRT
jgi:hypothetical protein